MRYDRIRRVLVVVVAGLFFLPATLFTQQSPYQVRKPRLSFISGNVTLQRPDAPEEIPAQVNMPIEEGLEVSTLGDSSASVELENGSMIRLSELTTANFTQLNKDAGGNQQLVLTLDQGYASFQFIPERQDAYKVKIADATLTPYGKTEFQTAFKSGMVHVRVLTGAISVSAHSNSLTLGKGKSMVYQPSPDAEVAKSHARVVRLSYVSGTVMVKRPGSGEEEPALVNTPIQEGFELSTSGGSYAEVEFENGSTARVGERSKLLFHQLALDANGNKLNGITFEQGYATFHFLPEHNSRSSANKPARDGTIYFQPTSSDVYHVKIASATVTADAKCEFRTDLEQDRFRVGVFSGSVEVATPTLSSKLGEGKILEHKSGGTDLALNIQKGIGKDAWDHWTDARDKQVLLTAKDEPVHPLGPSYGWSDLNTYGEWVVLPGRRFGWSPYARAGWSPYTNGRWEWYPGFGWTWISGEPWGWVTDHCGLWDFDGSFGWYWMSPMFGCGLWEPSMVNWYGGAGWIGWVPRGRPGTGGPWPGHPGSGRPGPGHPGPGHPGPGHPGPEPGPGHIPRGLTTVSTSMFQSRQLITPQIVNPVQPTVGSMIDRPPFGPSPRPASAATSPALNAGTTSKSSSTGATAPPAPGVGTTSQSNTLTATATAAPAPISGWGPGFGSHHGSAPATILMGGDAAKERALLAGHQSHTTHAPLRAFEGTTLGGRYAMHGSPGEFRGNAFGGGGRHGGASGMSGPVVGSSMSHPYGGGSGAVIASHGSAGGGSHGGGYSGGGGGYSAAGGHSGGGGGGYSGGGGHSGSGGGGGLSGGGGHSGGGGGGASSGGGGSSGGGHH